MLWLLQAWQKILPQKRQWCFLRNRVKGREQAVQALQAESGIQKRVGEEVEEEKEREVEEREEEEEEEEEEAMMAGGARLSEWLTSSDLI